MSWYNPTPDEATDAYTANKNKYADAASQLRASQRQEDNYRAAQRSAVAQQANLASQKLNFEKRLEGIQKIVKMLEGSGGWFSTNVPEAIADGTRTLRKLDDSYRKSIRCDTPATSLEAALGVPTVEGDPRSAAALQSYKNEAVRLEQSIQQINSQLASLAAQIATLAKNIQACDAAQSALRRVMNGASYEMNHYKPYMGG